MGITSLLLFACSFHSICAKAYFELPAEEHFYNRTIKRKFQMGHTFAQVACSKLLVV